MAGPGRHRRHRRVRETAEAGYSAEPAARGIAGVLLDSDVIIEILRGRHRFIEAIGRLEAGGAPTYTCALSVAEIFAGIRAGEEAIVEGFFDVRGEVVIDSTTGRRAGSYLSRFARSHGLSVADAIIAATASTSGLRLWTMNRRHYPMKDLAFYEP